MKRSRFTGLALAFLALQANATQNWPETYFGGARIGHNPKETTLSAAKVLLGDPGRAYFPQSGVRQLANYKVRTSRELEDRDIREKGVYRLSECSV
jgi:hypothetical protein